MDESIFLKEISANKGIIHKLVLLYANRVEEKEDLYQEILYQAWRSWPGFRGESKFSTWLYRISLNTILTGNRKKYPVVLAGNTEPFEHLAEDRSEQNDNLQQLYKLIRSLPETDRAIISLHLDGFDHQEISEMMGISRNAMAVKLHRIKNYLIQKFEK